MAKITKHGSYRLEIHDDEISKSVHDIVNDFLINSEYQVNFYDPPHSKWYPKSDTWVTERNWPSQPRLPLAWDDHSLRHRAAPIWQLWQEINLRLDNQFVIEGVPESMRYLTGISPLSGIDLPDGTPGLPKSAWRVYGSGNERELRARTKSVHRDSPYLDRDDFLNVVYFANTEWHPQFYGETLFHGDHAHSGDFTGRFEKDQARQFPIGAVENVVDIRPGRFMLFDARYLHQVKPAAHYAPNILGVVFRLKKI